MSNYAYLLKSNTDYVPAMDQEEFDNKEGIILVSPYYIPTMWYFLFSPHSIKQGYYHQDGKRYTKRDAPTYSLIEERYIAIGRLKHNKEWASRMFEQNGGLEHHFDILASYLNEFTDKYIQVEFSEIEDANGSEELRKWNKSILEKIENKDFSVYDELVEMADLIPDRKFVTLDDIKSGKFEQEDRWNYFRIIGDYYWGNHCPKWG